MGIMRFMDFNESKRKTDREINIDELLDRISSDGIESLSKSELAFLNGETGADEVGIDLDKQEETFDLIDSEGNFLDSPDKSRFLLKLKYYEEDSFGDENNNYIEVEVYDPSGKYLMDIPFDMAFPEVSSIGLEDMGGGSMVYYGRMTRVELSSQLKSMGFNIQK